MSKVYIVTEGDYDDYRIIGVFGNKDAAAEAARDSNGQVEVWPLCETVEDSWAPRSTAEDLSWKDLHPDWPGDVPYDPRQYSLTQAQRFERNLADPAWVKRWVAGIWNVSPDRIADDTKVEIVDGVAHVDGSIIGGRHFHVEQVLADTGS